MKPCDEPDCDTAVGRHRARCVECRSVDGNPRLVRPEDTNDEPDEVTHAPGYDPNPVAAVREAFVAGDIDDVEFEARLDALIEDGTVEDPDDLLVDDVTAHTPVVVELWRRLVQSVEAIARVAHAAVSRRQTRFVIVWAFVSATVAHVFGVSPAYGATVGLVAYAAGYAMKRLSTSPDGYEAVLYRGKVAWVPEDEPSCHICDTGVVTHTPPCPKCEEEVEDRFLNGGERV